MVNWFWTGWQKDERPMAEISKECADLNLERARENLARVQDLPSSSRVRREAELAYAEARMQAAPVAAPLEEQTDFGGWEDH